MLRLRQGITEELIHPSAEPANFAAKANFLADGSVRHERTALEIALG
jgi:hypothetical protein